MLFDLLKCPHCQKNAIDSTELLSISYIISRNKKCRRCYKKIRLNIVVYFIHFFGGGIFVILTMFLYAYLFASPCEKIIALIFDRKIPICGYLVFPLAIIAIVLFYYIISKRFNLRLFSKEEGEPGTI